jgi:gluconate 2-dehydrogenase gamma chain
MQPKDITTRREALKLGLLGLAGAALPISNTLAESSNEHRTEHQTEHQTHKSAPHSAHATQPHKTTYLFFNKQEAQFVEAAVARLIPKDEKWGGALEAGVPNYIDKQLAGSWGAGERLYRSGPWQPGTPQQGYQLPYTPAEFYRTGLRALNKELRGKNTPFHEMSVDSQDAYLHELEKSDHDLDGIPAKVFFATFLKSTIEGYFADPVYGGNHDMMAWRMIGFPGAGASYYELIDKHGIKIDRAPISIAQDAHGHVHENPNIPAKIPGK